jgi:endoglucanase
MPSPRQRRRTAFVAAGIAAVLGGTAVATAHAQEDDEPTDLIQNGDFADGTASWWATANLTGAVDAGEWCLDVPGPTANPWDAIIGQNDLPLTSGETYELRFTARASRPVNVRALVQRDIDPWPTALEEFPSIGTEAQAFSYAFTANVDWDDAQLAFQIGRQAEPWQFCLSEVSLLTDAEPPTHDPDTGPRVRVNQVAYLPDGPKHATLVTEADAPLAWSLEDGSGATVASGQTEVYGDEATSGEHLHTIDFSSVTATGEGFTITADGETSYPFAISGAVYDELTVDALSFFYPQRSGIEILDEIAPGYGRPAGHVAVPPTPGHGAVPCFQGRCDYTLDVTGGWYDAGDHGKYVVNGGISVAQLMGVYERSLHAPSGDPSRHADGSLRIPEHGNGVPDVLDEARWQMEFMLKMQVPEGETLAGMAHHKMHDERWTGLPLMPHLDEQPRFLHPPSTAATLNLAATGAQCARLYAPYDAAFAADCLDAAERAWDAALANPDHFAATGGEGGGPYDDTEVDDEFYWAAAELYLTTGAKRYADFIADSEQHTADVFIEGGMYWGGVGALGRLQLATVPNALPDRDRVIASVIEGAEKYLDNQAAGPWHLSYGANGVFDWGSTSAVLNSMVVMATAYDLSGEDRFRDGVVVGMDYLLGRNALGNSYVTGYGTHYSKNQHSRWYANQIDANLPNPPKGTIAGGPNTITGTWDPVMQRWLQGCAPQRCYIDDIGSWASNELTINWNAPLAWVASFIADQVPAAAPASSCKVDYIVHGSWPDGFNVQVIVTNNGSTSIQGVGVTWAMPVGQSIRNHWSADISVDGHVVTATDLGRGYPLKPGKSYTFGFIGQKGSGPTLQPSSVRCFTS